MNVKQVLAVRKSLELEGIPEDDWPSIAMRLKDARDPYSQTGKRNNPQIGERFRFLGFDVVVVWD